MSSHTCGIATLVYGTGNGTAKNQDLEFYRKAWPLTGLFSEIVKLVLKLSVAMFIFHNSYCSDLLWIDSQVKRAS